MPTTTQEVPLAALQKPSTIEPVTLEELALANQQHALLQKQANAALAERNRLIAKAVRQGQQPPVIAGRLGLSRTRVSQIAARGVQS